jgi:hypothetical protein
MGLPHPSYCDFGSGHRLVAVRTEANVRLSLEYLAGPGKLPHVSVTSGPGTWRSKRAGRRVVAAAVRARRRRSSSGC